MKHIFLVVALLGSFALAGCDGDSDSTNATDADEQTQSMIIGPGHVQGEEHAEAQVITPGHVNAEGASIDAQVITPGHVNADGASTDAQVIGPGR